MALHLIAVHVDAAKEVCAAVNIEHDPPTGVLVLLPLVVVRPHLDPFGLQRAWVGLPPLPPLAPADLANALWSELGFEQAGGVLELVGRDSYVVDLDPLWVRDPLGREGLQLLDGVVGDILQERTDEVQTLVVGEMSRRALV